MHSLHVTGVSRMLVLVVQLHVIGLAQSFLIVIVNIKCNIIVFIVRDSLFQFGSFLLNLFLLVSAEFNFSLSICIIAIHGEFDWRICSSLTVCSQLRYWSSTVTRYLNWNLHICWHGQNRFFYNCSIITHLSFYHVILLM